MAALWNVSKRDGPETPRYASLLLMAGVCSKTTLLLVDFPGLGWENFKSDELNHTKPLGSMSDCDGTTWHWQNSVLDSHDHLLKPESQETAVHLPIQHVRADSVWATSQSCDPGPALQLGFGLHRKK